MGSSFETIVRPMILPNIRPGVARQVTFTDDPDSGKCVISGTGTSTITSSYNETVNIQRSGATEDQRQFDEVRVRAEGGGGDARAAPRAGDGDFYIDVEVVKKIWLKGSDGKKFTRNYTEIVPEGNMTILRRDVTR